MRPQEPNAPSRVLDQPMEFKFSAGGIGRPVDITRSGENDEFGRDVDPRLEGDDAASVWLAGIGHDQVPAGGDGPDLGDAIASAAPAIPILDQSIVLAATRSGFPVPPRGAKLADRIFLVTYIYENRSNVPAAPRVSACALPSP